MSYLSKGFHADVLQYSVSVAVLEDAFNEMIASARSRLTGKNQVDWITFHGIRHYDVRKPELRLALPPVALRFDEDMVSD